MLFTGFTLKLSSYVTSPITVPQLACFYPSGPGDCFSHTPAEVFNVQRDMFVRLSLPVTLARNFYSRAPYSFK
jgi:hypothetical protein